MYFVLGSLVSMALVPVLYLSCIRGNDQHIARETLHFGKLVTEENGRQAYI
jgi:hypothetical protein